MGIHDSLNFIDYAVVGGYILALLALGFWVSLKKDHEEELIDVDELFEGLDED